MKKLLLTMITLWLILGTTAFAVNDDLTASVSITNLAGYGGILEIYQDEEDTPFITQVIPNKATSVTVENLEQGNYRAVIRGGVAVYEELKFVILTTYNSGTGCYETEDVVLTAKFEEPELTKLADRKTAKVGDRIKYTLQIALPEYALEDEDKTCIIGDMGGEGLSIDESTVKFYPCDEKYQKTGEAIQMSDVATIVMDPVDGMKIEITDYTSFRERVNGNLLVVEYEAVVTENAGNLKSTENYAYLEWRDGFDDDFKEVFTYRMHVKGLPGSIYTESINRKDFQDYITLIYGHDMHDGSMFKHLHKFSDAKFFDEHDTITIYTEEAILKYKVLAAVAYDKRHIMYNFDQSKFEDREEFVQSLHQSKNWKNQYREGVEVNEDSKLVVLSTCITGQPDKRWIVVGVSVEK